MVFQFSDVNEVPVEAPYKILLDPDVKLAPEDEPAIRLEFISSLMSEGTLISKDPSPSKAVAVTVPGAAISVKSSCGNSARDI